MANRDRDDAPARGKKKKKAQPASRWPLYAALAGGGVLALLVLTGIVVGGIVLALKTFGAPAQPVTAWHRYSSEEQEFGFDIPAGWNLRSYGIKDRREVNVTTSGASITVKENLTGSLIGDIAGAANQGRPVPDDQTPVAKVHELRKPEGAKEEPAVTVNCKLGKARKSAYTSGSRRGYRATVLLHQTALDIFCECSQSDWETLRPAFDRVIESLGRGE